MKKKRQTKDDDEGDRDGGGDRGAHQPHDALFTGTFSTEDLCAEILRLVLTEEEAALFDWTTLRIRPGSFVTDRGAKRRADLVLDIRAKDGGDGARVVFLMEHKSHKDAPGALDQLFEYQALFHFEEKGRGKTPIIPIVFHHGREDWPGPLRYRSLLKGAGTAVLEVFGDGLLNFDCRVLDIRKLDLPKDAKGLTCRPILYIMQRIWDLDDKQIAECGRQTEEVADEAVRKRFLLAVVWYITSFRRDYDEKRVMGILKGGFKRPELVPSFIKDARREGVERGREEGIEQGIERGRKEGIERGREEGVERGREEVALRMLGRGMAPADVAALTGLPEKAVDGLRKKARPKSKA